MRQLSHLTLAPFLLVGLISPCALAKEPSAGEKLATMRIDGEIEVGPDGRVSDHTITTAVPDELRAMIARQVVDWTFHPPMKDGAATAVRGKMRITLASRKQGDDAYAVKMENITFLDSARVEAPRGRYELVGTGGGYVFSSAGSLSMVVRLAPDGTILNASPTQCAVFATPGYEYENACKKFERYGRRLAANQRFRYLPAAGESMPTEPLVGIFVLDFQVSPLGNNEVKPGKWRPEWRSRYKPAPWLASDVPRIGASDLTAKDGFVAMSTDLPRHAHQGVGASD